MRKIGFLLGTLLISCTLYANNTTDLKSYIAQGVKQQSVSNQTNSSILYAGEDISRIIIVTEKGTQITGASSFVG